MFASRCRMFVAAATLAAAALALSAGCQSEAKQKRRTGSAKGTVTKIDLPNNNVSMKIIHPKTGKELEVAGTITAITEVWINGVRKTPADVEVNDDIRVEYERSGEELEQKFVVSRVEVTRPETWKSTRPPGSTTPVSLAKPGGTMEDLHKADQAQTEKDGGTNPRFNIPAAPATSPADRAVKEQEVTDLIFSEIRKKMVEAITERAALLKAGKPADDPEVVKHEGVIRKARSLLMERGENVEPIDPPLPEDRPTTKPAA